MPGFTREMLANATPELEKFDKPHFLRAYNSFSEGKVVCEWEAEDKESIAKAYAQLGFPYDQIVLIAVIMASTNAVNLTDGLDGLATGTSIMVLAAYSLISSWQYQHWCSDPSIGSEFCYPARDPLEAALIAAAAAGACLGFLWWNTSPARIIMGDTGSMALGGLIAGQAVATRTIMLLPVIAALFVIITMSRIIQYLSFKTTGKRVFRMSPLHHHFEMVGWSEVNIVIRFWIIAGAGAVIGLGALYADFLNNVG